jgi:two-component system LytT family response regulator
MLQALIIDDEVNCSQTLQLKLTKYCPTVTILETINSPLEAEAAIRNHKPDIVFLDIEMPHLNGFDLLNLTKDIAFEVVFTTAFDHYALKAIKHSALDYLLKPIDNEELIAVVKRAEEKAKLSQGGMSRIETLLEQLSNDRKLTKLSVPSMDGIEYYEFDSIIRIEAERNYSVLHLVGGKTVTSSRSLKIYEDLLASSPSFFRVHSAHLVNLKFAKTFIRGEGGILVMDDESRVEVSRQKKKELLKILG